MIILDQEPSLLEEGDLNLKVFVSLPNSDQEPPHPASHTQLDTQLATVAQPKVLPESQYAPQHQEITKPEVSTKPGVTEDDLRPEVVLTEEVPVPLPSLHGKEHR